MDNKPIIGQIPSVDNSKRNNKAIRFFSQTKIIVLIIIFILSLVVFYKIELSTKEDNYQKALNEYERKNYQQAQSIFDSLKDYKDSIQKSAQCSSEIELLKKENDYKKALQEYENKNYQQAQNIFDSLIDYKDSINKSIQCKLMLKENDYQKALKEYENKNYQQAQSIFDSLKEYKDSNKMSVKCRFMIEVGIEFCKCPNGKFLMGSYEKDKEKFSNEYQRNIKITNDFYIGKYEVTQKQYKIIMENNPSKNNKNSDNFPVENVSWDKANEFCAKLTEKYKGMLEEGYIFDLPTEAQWEYACRAGTKESRYGEIEKIAWYYDNSKKLTKEVGQKNPNAWGIYDMLGNVWEWCKDNYESDIPHEIDTVYNDPYIINNSDKYVSKGGSCCNNSEFICAGYRIGSPSKGYYYDSGFRVAIVKDNTKNQIINKIPNNATEIETMWNDLLLYNNEGKKVSFDFWVSSYSANLIRKAKDLKEIITNSSYTYLIPTIDYYIQSVEKAIDNVDIVLVKYDSEWEKRKTYYDRKIELKDSENLIFEDWFNEKGKHYGNSINKRYSVNLKKRYNLNLRMREKNFLGRKELKKSYPGGLYGFELITKASKKSGLVFQLDGENKTEIKLDWVDPRPDLKAFEYKQSQ